MKYKRIEGRNIRVNLLLFKAFPLSRNDLIYDYTKRLTSVQSFFRCNQGAIIHFHYCNNSACTVNAINENILAGDRY